MSGSFEKILRLKEEFEKLPGIGPRTAERLTFHILTSKNEDVMKLVQAITDMKENVKYCRECNNICDDELCNICANGKRDKTVLCVVEFPRDLWKIEQSGVYKGLYYVLYGKVAPLDGKHPEDIMLKGLTERLRKDKIIREVIVATSPDTEGDMTALFIKKILSDSKIKLTRIGRGIPPGSTIDYANSAVINYMINERKEM